MVDDGKRNGTHTALKEERPGGRHMQSTNMQNKTRNGTITVFTKGFMTEYSASSKVEAAISKHLADEEEGKQW